MVVFPLVEIGVLLNGLEKIQKDVKEASTRDTTSIDDKTKTTTDSLLFFIPVIVLESMQQNPEVIDIGKLASTTQPKQARLQKIKRRPAKL